MTLNWIIDSWSRPESRYSSRPLLDRPEGNCINKLCDMIETVSMKFMIHRFLLVLSVILTPSSSMAKVVGQDCGELFEGNPLAEKVGGSFEYWWEVSMNNGPYERCNDMASDLFRPCGKIRIQVFDGGDTVKDKNGDRYSVDLSHVSTVKTCKKISDNLYVEKKVWTYEGDIYGNKYNRRSVDVNKYRIKSPSF